MLVVNWPVTAWPILARCLLDAGRYLQPLRPRVGMFKNELQLMWRFARDSPMSWHLVPYGRRDKSAENIDWADKQDHHRNPLLSPFYYLSGRPLHSLFVLSWQYGQLFTPAITQRHQEFIIDPDADPDAVCEWILAGGPLPFSPLAALSGCKLLPTSWFSSPSSSFGIRISFFPLAL